MFYLNKNIKGRMHRICAFISLIVLSVSATLYAQVPVLVRDINPGQSSSSPQELTEFAGKLYFGTSKVNGLWMTDGTDLGTVQTDGGSSIIGNDYVSQLTVFNRQLFFNTDLNPSWWSTAGGIDNAIEITDNFNFLKGVSYDSTALAETDLVFAGLDFNISGSAINLYCSNGNMLDAIGNFESDSNGPRPKGFKTVNSQLIFSAVERNTGRELYSTDATTGTTFLIKDINPGKANSLSDKNGLDEGIVLGNELCFPALSNEPSGSKLWCTDGTTGGTFALYDEEGVKNGTQADYDSPHNLTVYNNFINFFANVRGSKHAQLFRVSTTWRDPTIPIHPTQITFDDGRSAKGGTINGGIIGANNKCDSDMKPMVVDDNLYFPREDSNNGCELWKSDGTTDGTEILKDINPGGEGSVPVLLAGFNGELYFAATKEGYGKELWHTNGKASGTQLVSDLNPGSKGSIVNDSMLEYNGELYYVADDGIHGQELYKISFPAKNQK